MPKNNNKRRRTQSYGGYQARINGDFNSLVQKGLQSECHLHTHNTTVCNNYIDKQGRILHTTVDETYAARLSCRDAHGHPTHIHSEPLRYLHSVDWSFWHADVQALKQQAHRRVLSAQHLHHAHYVQHDGFREHQQQKVEIYPSCVPLPMQERTVLAPVCHAYSSGIDPAIPQSGLVYDMDHLPPEPASFISPGRFS